uniref:DUF4220 domain-containing protein n=1 Tax=Davidia involucrata TaxID=16924 RepID=A0A5B7BA25_DAVIN
MLFTVASALMYVEKRRLVEVFPESVKQVWNEWELQVIILLSLTLQIVLVLLGDRRKYIARTRIRIILWSAYLTADWVATVALGIISRNSQDNCHPSRPGGVDHDATGQLMSFWAPFLLLHLGGPDTITAYSLEDNELWLRHLLGLAVQTGGTLYIFLLAWPGSSWLPILTIPMLQAGLIKYGERTWALRSANSEHLRDSMLSPPDAGPNYAKFMEEFTLKKAEGFHVRADEVIEPPVLPTHNSDPNCEGQLILKAYHLFQTFKRLFVDLILSYHDRESSQSFFKELTAEQAFHVVEVELGFAYDILYTKAPVVYTVGGCFLRFFTISSTFSVLVAFIFLCEKSEFHKIDLTITYLLLVVALLLEIYAVYAMLNSDWTDHWSSKRSRNRHLLMISSCLRQPKKQWWSNSIAQYNLLVFCLEDKPAVCLGIQRLLQIDEFRGKHRYKTYSKVSKELKGLIFKQFWNFTKKNEDGDTRALCTHRGSFVLKEYDPLFDSTTLFEWTTGVEFDQRILILHIATDLCFYWDGGENPNTVSSNCRESKHISDYMLYLLVMCPFLLPIGIGLIRFRDTCAEAREFFEEKGPINGKAKACEKFLHLNTEVLPMKVKGDRSKSVLFDACRLAQKLQKIQGGKENKWEIVSGVWVEMLAYAASHCRGHHHAQQLRKGGELLTHVWLLMAHLGITEQFQISKGHARAKLIVK